MPSRIVQLAAILLLASLGGCANSRPGADDAKSNVPGERKDVLVVRVELAQKRTIAETVDAWGRCEALPERIASLTPAVEGRVEALLLKIGQPVHEGQPVIELDARIAEDNLADKTAARDALAAALALLKAPPRPEELKSQELEIEQAKLTLDKAKAAADRLRPLLERKEISGAQMFEADLAITQAELHRQTAESQLRVMKLGPRPEAVDEAQAKVDAAQAAVDSAQVQLKLHTIRSPIDGMLDSLTCRLGQTTAAGAVVGEVVDTEQLAALVWLPARDAGQVRVGQPAEVSPGGTRHHANDDANSDQDDSRSANRKRYAGQITFVGRIADQQTGNLPVRIEFDNSFSQFVPGQTVLARITVKETQDVLAVPLAAVYDVGEGPVISLVRDGKSAPAHPTLGIRDRQCVQVLGTDLEDELKAGESVIVEGGYNLPPGTPVEISPSPSERGPG